MRRSNRVDFRVSLPTSVGWKETSCCLPRDHGLIHLEIHGLINCSLILETHHFIENLGHFTVPENQEVAVSLGHSRGILTTVLLPDVGTNMDFPPPNACAAWGRLRDTPEEVPKLWPHTHLQRTWPLVLKPICMIAASTRMLKNSPTWGILQMQKLFKHRSVFQV